MSSTLNNPLQVSDRPPHYEELVFVGWIKTQSNPDKFQMIFGPERLLKCTHHQEAGEIPILYTQEPLIETSSPYCKIKGCHRKKSTSRGWCSMHYARWQRGGDNANMQPGPIRND